MISTILKTVMGGNDVSRYPRSFPRPEMRLAPIGYLNDPATRTIIPDSDRFGAIKEIWRLMLTGVYSQHRIMEIANHEWGLRTIRRKRSGGKVLSLSGVYRTNALVAVIGCRAEPLSMTGDRLLLTEGTLSWEEIQRDHPGTVLSFVSGSAIKRITAT